jgi:hypothetical protein
MHISLRKTLVTSFVLLAGGLSAAACTDVTVQPKSTVSSANIFSDTASYKAFIAKLYGGLALTGTQGPAGNGDIQGIDEGFSQYLRLLWQMEELPTDEVAIAWNDAGVQELNTQLWSSSNQFLVSMYYRIFYQVSLANEFLRQTTDAELAARGVTGTLASNVKTYRAEARFLRALSYWHAIDLFGDVPLVTEANAVGKTPPPQSTRAEIYNFVVSELTAARNDLPAPKAGDYGRADQGAVAMLLAKLYMNAQVYTGTAHYAEALAEVQRVISSGAYQLDPNYIRMFRADNDKSPELIFTVPQDALHTQSYGGTTFLTHAAAGGNMDPAKLGLDGAWWGIRMKPELVALFPGAAASADKRASVFFTDGQSLAMTNLTDFQKGIANLKYVNVTSTGGAPQGNQFSDVDYPMFRLGDAYLMYAEAVLRGGGGTRAQALTYVNQLRARAYGNASGNITDAQLTLPFLLDERARELLWEGHRRTDLIRFNTFTTAGVWAWKGNVQAGKTTEAFRNLYPLPASELLANPNLKQNAGY